MIMKLDL